MSFANRGWRAYTNDLIPLHYLRISLSLPTCVQNWVYWQLLPYIIYYNTVCHFLFPDLMQPNIVLFFQYSSLYFFTNKTDFTAQWLFLDLLCSPAFCLVLSHWLVRFQVHVKSYLRTISYQISIFFNLLMQTILTFCNQDAVMHIQQQTHLIIIMCMLIDHTSVCK